MTNRTWVVLTMGDRPDALTRALESIRRADGASPIVLVINAEAPLVSPAVPSGVDVIVTGENLGIPGGRDLAVRRSDAEVIAFLDDDAEIMNVDVSDLLDRAFQDPSVGATSFRLCDEAGLTARRHNPRVGGRNPERPGPTAAFLGGACAIRRSAYIDAGGYWSRLFYAHEELDLGWRLRNRGYDVVYDPRVEVYHPATEISRHSSGWRLTGRNRVLVARRNLPAPVLLVHVLTWLLLGIARCPNWSCRRAYIAGWYEGWRERHVPRRPMSWRTVWSLARLGRPPII